MLQFVNSYNVINDEQGRPDEDIDLNSLQVDMDVLEDYLASDGVNLSNFLIDNPEIVSDLTINSPAEVCTSGTRAPNDTDIPDDILDFVIEYSDLTNMQNTETDEVLTPVTSTISSPSEVCTPGTCSPNDSNIPYDILGLVAGYGDMTIMQNTESVEVLTPFTSTISTPVEVCTPGTYSTNGTDVLDEILELVTGYGDPANMTNTNMYNDLENFINENQRVSTIDSSAPLFTVGSYSPNGTEEPTNIDLHKELQGFIKVSKSGSSPSSMKIKKRTPEKYREPYTQSQLSILQESFRRCEKLNLDERFALSLKTNLSERQVKYWFQNQRRKIKSASLCSKMV